MIFNFLFRIIHILVQTLVSGIITDVFIINPDLLNALFDHLDELELKDSPRCLIRSECIAKIMSILFDKFTIQVIFYYSLLFKIFFFLTKYK